MNHLIIYIHPNPKSFCHAILETLKKTLRAKGGEVRVRDLYDMKLNPVMKKAELKPGTPVAKDVKREQNHIKWADTMTWIYPIWWQRMPAIGNGYIDRVLLEGFAHENTPTGPKGLLGDKKVFMINTMNAPTAVYEQSGLFNSMRQTIDEGVFGYCGMKVINHKYFGLVAHVSYEERKKMLDEVKVFAKTIL
ncbi:MAG: hypothetical protein A3G33_07900 [Omnitrophica bacterium RIFCSPLOWO2_12_FULL_44_17]|uniref:Flavodoxin-like fold domain-containing protein n=1 Tax=Candidatus Danuiimicrobium aquiferis TaxID=1801832 RepID=A0A1G1L2Z7_9BACT|nr:MAG: hypothetical protein A3B72_05685 [Omnitrophica bacterium RIFCSPHIGHO2_02_FULL_45_28]OGW92436.1 MAG: hypothetical protein A3E74_04120 [Omnitrophica bacterium RIFCSPHIGHO2_12_FULL_44_12]OGW99525.1 MAG: hypothetical protein A3G33_07900 [Omnitrophica bacterium RIFCSPLOWO2_12_FULL_44_17]OGX02697.1 MAG: hypothetical protein A3J12_06895 [Omnitrophica bacterium RIFCSPLOWO2_02_FULL_44_11]